MTNKEQDRDSCPMCGAEYKGQEVDVLGPSKTDKGKVVLKTRCLSCNRQYYFKVKQEKNNG